MVVVLEDSRGLSESYAGSFLVSFVQHIIGLWNSLPQEVVGARSLVKFNRGLGICMDNRNLQRYNQ